jgi:hypothetical protein
VVESSRAAVRPGESDLARATAWMLGRIETGELTDRELTEPSCWHLIDWSW